jgi:hypothetical protein
MVGWALAQAWSDGKYVQLGAAYLLAVCLHGLWNVFGVMIGVFTILPPGGASPALELSRRLGAVSPVALAVLMVTLFLILNGFNRRLQPQP